MIVNSRRGLVISAVLLAGAVTVGALVAIPATAVGVQWVDDAVWRLADDIRLTPLVWLARLMALLGSVWVNWPLRVAAAVVLAVRRQWVALTAFTLAVLTSEALIGPVKLAYDRPRPAGALIATSGASFPSGHAVAGAVTAVGLVIVLLPPGRPRWRWEVRAVLFSFLMALSRVYLRAHWLSDVVAGGLLGAGLALGWPALLQSIRDGRRRSASGAGRAGGTAPGRVPGRGAATAPPQD